MRTLESIRSSITSVEQMLSVVKTMKARAAVSIRAYQEAVAALAEYTETIAQGLQVVLMDQPPVELTRPLTGHRLGVIVYGSEQGLAGHFNSRIAAFTREALADLDDDPAGRRIMAVGERVAGHLADSGLEVTGVTQVPGSLQSIRFVGQEVLLRIDDWRATHGIERILLFYNTPVSSASYEARQRWLLPVNPRWLRSLQNGTWNSRRLPVYRADRDRLFSELIRQYLYVTLFRAFAESLASENASRLAAMQSAEQNIEERLDTLHATYQHRRQSAITEELLDIAAGFEALTGGTP